MASPPAKMGKRCQGFYAGFNSRRIFRFNFGIGRFSLRVRDRVDHFGATCTFVTSGDASRYLLKRVADGVPASQDERKVPRFLRWI